MTDIETKLAVILSCLPDSPFKAQVRQVHADVLSEINRLQQAVNCATEQCDKARKKE